MSLLLTYWEDATIKRTPDDYDGISEVRLKSVKQIPNLIAARPARTAMISLEHTGARILKSGRKTNFMKKIWKRGQGSLERPKLCPCCQKQL